MVEAPAATILLVDDDGPSPAGAAYPEVPRLRAPGPGEDRPRGPPVARRHRIVLLDHHSRTPAGSTARLSEPAPPPAVVVIRHPQRVPRGHRTPPGADDYLAKDAALLETLPQGMEGCGGIGSCGGEAAAEQDLYRRTARRHRRDDRHAAPWDQQPAHGALAEWSAARRPGPAGAAAPPDAAGGPGVPGTASATRRSKGRARPSGARPACQGCNTGQDGVALSRPGDAPGLSMVQVHEQRIVVLCAAARGLRGAERCAPAAEPASGRVPPRGLARFFAGRDGRGRSAPAGGASIRRPRVAWSFCASRAAHGGGRGPAGAPGVIELPVRIQASSRPTWSIW